MSSNDGNTIVSTCVHANMHPNCQYSQITAFTAKAPSYQSTHFHTIHMQWIPHWCTHTHTCNCWTHDPLWVLSLTVSNSTISTQNLGHFSILGHLYPPTHPPSHSHTPILHPITPIRNCTLVIWHMPAFLSVKSESQHPQLLWRQEVCWAQQARQPGECLHQGWHIHHFLHPRAGYLHRCPVLCRMQRISCMYTICILIIMFKTVCDLCLQQH